LAGFGPYVAVYLADQKWTQEEVGFVLSASTFAGLLSQVPGGELLDATRSKRAILALGVLVVALSAIIIEFRPTFPLVLIGLTLQGVTGGILGPAIAAISLGLVGHMALPERLGRNQRFAATGSLAAAALMGLTGYIFSYQAIFLLVVVLTLPVFVSLARIHATDIHFGRSCGAPLTSRARATYESRPHEPLEEPRFARSCPLPVLVSARQRVNVAAYRRVPDISGRRSFVPHRIGIDSSAADRSCCASSLGWTRG
jgi:MFS family permease